MRVRLLALISAAALLGLAAVPASASSEGHGYLALGDSVPFGFNPLADPTSANNFVGYPEIVAQKLNIEDVNASCPGEATGGFLSLTGTDNVCRPYRFTYGFPLHVAYSSSQIDFALNYLRSNPRTRLVTLMLGANDVFHLQNVCGFDNPADPIAYAACVNSGLPGVLATMEANLNAIFTDIRGTGYKGLVVAVTYYALNYSDPVSVGGSLALNAEMMAAAAGHNVLIASGFDAWKSTALAAPADGDSCAAGLLLPAAPAGSPGCDVHPTALGRDLLASAVLQTIADSCPARSPIGCLNRNRS
jgi:lysophospholipase L1-like esterase